MKTNATRRRENEQEHMAIVGNSFRDSKFSYKIIISVILIFIDRETPAIDSHRQVGWLQLVSARIPTQTPVNARAAGAVARRKYSSLPSKLTSIDPLRTSCLNT